MFSSSRCSFVVPGMGTIHGRCARIQAKCDLRGGGVFLLGEAGQELDEGAVCLPCLGVGEAGDGVAEVAALEGRAYVDPAGQEALAERAERHEADAELFECREDRVFRLAPPQRVLALKRCHRLHAVGAADVLHARLGQAEVPHLALGDQLLDRAGNVLHRHLGIDAMLVEQVDVVGA